MEMKWVRFRFVLDAMHCHDDWRIKNQIKVFFFYFKTVCSVNKSIHGFIAERSRYVLLTYERPILFPTLHWMFLITFTKTKTNIWRTKIDNIYIRVFGVSKSCDLWWLLPITVYHLFWIFLNLNALHTNIIIDFIFIYKAELWSQIQNRKYRYIDYLRWYYIITCICFFIHVLSWLEAIHVKHA